MRCQGEKAEHLKTIRVPIGHGIVSLVAQTGEPMAISDVQSDPRHATDVGQRVGYVSRSIVAVPLFYESRVVGVPSACPSTDVYRLRTTPAVTH
jgi:signal transduction protein with GAF and PtsI domain